MTDILSQLDARKSHLDKFDPSLALILARAIDEIKRLRDLEKSSMLAPSP